MVLVLHTLKMLFWERNGTLFGALLQLRPT